MTPATNIVPFPSQSKSMPPTLADIKARAAEIGLSEREAERMYLFYDSKGWMVGKSPMKQWRSSLALWKMNCEERGGTTSPARSGANTVILGQEYQRVLTRMKAIKDTYESHREWDAKDLSDFRRLKARRDVLRGILQIQI